MGAKDGSRAGETPGAPSHTLVNAQPWGLELMQFQEEAVRQGAPRSWLPTPKNLARVLDVTPHRLLNTERTEYSKCPPISVSFYPQGRGLSPSHQAVCSQEEDSTVNSGRASGTRCWVLTASDRVWGWGCRGAARQG